MLWLSSVRSKWSPGVTLLPAYVSKVSGCLNASTYWIMRFLKSPYKVCWEEKERWYFRVDVVFTY